MKTIRWQMVMEGEAEPGIGFSDAKSVSRFLVDRGHADRDREAFIVLLLNVKNRLIAEEIVSVGILDGSLIHPREVFKAAVAGSAASIVIAHNHPSGDPSPSQSDREVTKRLRDAGTLLGIPMVDHVIIAPEGTFFSFRESTDWR